MVIALTPEQAAAQAAIKEEGIVTFDLTALDLDHLPARWARYRPHLRAAKAAADRISPIVRSHGFRASVSRAMNAHELRSRADQMPERLRQTWSQLKYRSLHSDELGGELGYGTHSRRAAVRQVIRRIRRELDAQGVVEFHPDHGYYRPDAPPSWA